MILDKVKIKNYRQYRDVEIAFAKGESNNFTIINGDNGTGKTTLLNALSWCLYGNEIHDYGDESSMSICNNKTVYLAKKGERIPVSVKIKFIDEGEPLIFERTREYYKEGDIAKPSKMGDQFFTTKKENGKVVKEENDQFTLERKIPKEIEDYFFFDGARLSQYFQDTSNKNIKDSIYVISQLNLFENLSKNLPTVRSNFIKKQKEIAPELGIAQEKIEYYENKKKEAHETIKESNDLIGQCDEVIDEIETELLNKNAKTTEEDKKEFNRLKKDVKSINNQLNGTSSRKGLYELRKNNIIKNYPYILAYNYFNKFLELGKEYKEKGFVPSKFKRDFLEELLDEGVCICGSDLEHDTEHRRTILKMLEDMDEAEAYEDINYDLVNVKNGILKDFTDYKDNAIDYIKRIEELEDKKEELRGELARIKSKLDSSTYEDVQKLKIDLSDFRKERDNHIRKVSKAENTIDRCGEELHKWKQKKAYEEVAEVEVKELDTKIDLCSKVIAAADVLYEKLAGDMLEEIRSLTEENFVKIQWKEDEFTDIKINSKYEVSIKNKTGFYERPGDLSDGEKLCLGLCFMAAIHKVSGFDLPIIMDTPLANLGTKMRHNIAEFIPQIERGKQTVLLVTDSEYTDDFRETLGDVIGLEYHIEWEHSDEGKESKVVLNG